MTQLWRVDKAQAPAFTGDGALHLADRWDERHLGLRDWLRSHEIRWLVGLGIVTLCSWARWFATGSTKVDQNYPSEAVGTLLLVALCAGWGLAVIGWAGMLARPKALGQEISNVTGPSGLGLERQRSPIHPNHTLSG